MTKERPESGEHPDHGAPPEAGNRAGDRERPDDADRADKGQPPADQARPTAGAFTWLRRARRALTVIRGYTAVGLVLAVSLGALSFFYYEAELARWICRMGAMGSLLGAVVGLNVMDRLVRGRSMPAGAVAVAMALIAVALLGVGFGAIRYQLGAAWSPLVAATYVFVFVRIMLRLRAPSTTS